MILSTSAPLDAQNTIAPKKTKRNISRHNTKTSINGHEYVDLGLPSGTKWATCNIGANNPTDFGYYFAWGETSPKRNYTEGNCLTDGKSIGNISGKPAFDAARAKWGGTWRIPTATEMEELIEYCTWANTTENGVSGYRIISLNGNSIFLPTTGLREGEELVDESIFGNYWSSEPDDDPDGAVCLGFNAVSVEMGESTRYIGLIIRPVTK